MTIVEAAEWYHRTAVALFGLHATNSAAKLLGLPGLPGDIDAANTILVFVRDAQSERRSRAAVRRCRAARRPMRAKRRVARDDR